MSYFEAEILTGAVLIIGAEARIKVFLTEKAPGPLLEVALILY